MCSKTGSVESVSSAKAFYKVNLLWASQHKQSRKLDIWLSPSCSLRTSRWKCWLPVPSVDVWSCTGSPWRWGLRCLRGWNRGRCWRRLRPGRLALWLLLGTVGKSVAMGNFGCSVWRSHSTPSGLWPGINRGVPGSLGCWTLPLSQAILCCTAECTKRRN